MEDLQYIYLTACTDINTTGFSSWADPFYGTDGVNLKYRFYSTRGKVPHPRTLSFSWVKPSGQIISQPVKLANTIETNEQYIEQILSSTIKTIEDYK